MPVKRRVQILAMATICALTIKSVHALGFFDLKAINLASDPAFSCRDTPQTAYIAIRTWDEWVSYCRPQDPQLAAVHGKSLTRRSQARCVRRSDPFNRTMPKRKFVTACFGSIPEVLESFVDCPANVAQMAGLEKDERQHAATCGHSPSRTDCLEPGARDLRWTLPIMSLGEDGTRVHLESRLSQFNAGAQNGAPSSHLSSVNRTWPPSEIR